MSTLDRFSLLYYYAKKNNGNAEMAEGKLQFNDCHRIILSFGWWLSKGRDDLSITVNIMRIQATNLMSILLMWVSRDFPEPHGSMRYRDASTTPRTPPMSDDSGCSIDVDINAHTPRGRSVLQDLRGKQIMKLECMKQARSSYNQRKYSVTTLNLQISIIHSPSSTLHHPLSVIQSLSSTLHHPLFIIHSRHPLSIIHSLSSSLHHPLSIIHYPSSTLHHPLSIINSPSSNLYHLLSIIHSPSSTLCHPLFVIQSPSSTLHHPLCNIHSPSSTFHL